MSRYTFQLPISEENNPDGLILRVAYGYDPMGLPGYFYEEFIVLKQEVVDQPTDLDTRWGASRGEILEALSSFVDAGFVPEEHLDAITLDLPF